MSTNAVVFSTFGNEIPIVGSPWLRGDGLFETIKVQSGIPLLLERHLTRIKRSADDLLFDSVAIDSIRERSHELATKWSAPTGRMRITLLSDGNFIISIEELIDTAKYPVKLGIAPEPIHTNALLSGRKSLSYGSTPIHLRRAIAAGLTDLLILNERAEVVESSIANIFAVTDGQISTPPLSSGCLPGVARELLRELEPSIQERVLTVDDLRNADGLFLTSSLRGISQVSMLTHKGAVRNYVSSSAIDELATRLHERCWEESTRKG